jgi:hypothetical protein
MVSTLRLAALAVVGCLFFASVQGCAAEPTAPKEFPIDENSIPSQPSSGDSKESEDGDQAVPVTPVVADNGAIPAVPKVPTPGGTTDKAPTGTGTTTDTTKTQTCTSTNGGYKSLTTVDYTVSNGTATITKMTVNVTNTESRDKNDVDVYTTPSGGSESKDFNSGDILTHSETVAVPQAATMTVKAGSKVRISTNFDREFLTDPSASCTIQF